MVGITVASAGVRLATTRLVVSENCKNGGNVGTVVKVCILYSLVLSAISSVLLFAFSRVISNVLIENGKIALAFKILAIGIPFEAVTAVLCGYFSAVRRVLGMSVVTFLELAAKIAATVFLLSKINTSDSFSACNAAAAGICFSEICSFVLLMFLYLINIKDSGSIINKRQTFKSVSSVALPDGLSSIVRNLLISFEHFLIPYGLKKSGKNTAAALACYGVVTAMALPVVTFSSVIISSAAGLIITEVADFLAIKNKRGVDLLAARSIRLTMIFTIYCSGSLFYFADELCRAVFSSSDAVVYVKMLAPIVPVMYLDTVVDAFLKGAGLQLASMKINIADAFLSILLVYFLVPKLGISGYIVCIFITELFNFALSAAKLSTVLNVRLNIFTFILKPLFCTLGAVCAARLIMYFCGNRLSLSLVLLFEIILSMIVYFASLRFMGCVSENDIKWVKGLFGKKIRKRNRAKQ
ncbi:MAG: polysaccharide biosynthesis C-terminal domain-containing protein [Clostridia bacterium]|nr:polysaccharide biosynthesis C-terminal domain-containing protein [Clostridia bacterium]